MRIDLDFLCALADLIIVLAVVTIKTFTNMILDLIIRQQLVTIQVHLKFRTGL